MPMKIKGGSPKQRQQDRNEHPPLLLTDPFLNGPAVHYDCFL